MAQATRPDHPAPMAMTVAELEAAIAALPGKRVALREAFDRLAACSPSPLPFAWEDLDGHISSLQSSISLRFRQLRVLEAAGAAPGTAALRGTRGDGKGEIQEEEEFEEEEEVEVEVEVEEEGEEEKADEEIQEADHDKICNYEKDGREAREVEVEEEVAELEEAEEDMQEPSSHKIRNDEKDGKEAREVEVEEAAELEKKADGEIQEACNDEKGEAREVKVGEEEVAELQKTDEEMHEANRNKICNDEKYMKETRVVEVEEVVTELEKMADEEMKEADYHKIWNDEKDGKEASEEVLEEEEVEEAANVMIGSEIKDENEAWEEERTSKVNEHDPDKEMQAVDNDKDELDTKDAFKAAQGKEEEDQDTNMDETMAKMASSVQHMEVESCDKKLEQHAHEKLEQHAHEKVEVAKNVTDQVSSDQGNQAVPCRSNDHTVAHTKMDAQRLAKLICTNTEFVSEFHAAVRRAPDAAALALHVVEIFLQNKKFKTRKVWESCVGLLQMVPIVVTKPSADTIEQAKRVAKDWKEMTDNPECQNVDGSPSWGLLNFLISYNIVTEFDMKEIFCLFGNISLKHKKKSAKLLKGLGLGNRVSDLMDYLIGIGQQMDVLSLARIFNMADKYPPLSLLKGYVERAKQTAREISQKNTTQQLKAVVVKELDNLRRAQVLAKNEITNSDLYTSIEEEINILLGELEKKKQILSNSLTKSKKLKIQQKQEKKQRKHQQEQQPKHEDKPEEKKQKEEDEPGEKKRKQEDKPEEKQQQNKQKHQKQLRQCTPQLPTQVYPAMWNMALRGDFECPPYAAMHGLHRGYPAQPGWSGVHGASPFMTQLGAPEYIGPFTPMYPRPQFYPR